MDLTSSSPFTTTLPIMHERCCFLPGVRAVKKSDSSTCSGIEHRELSSRRRRWQEIFRGKTFSLTTYLSFHFSWIISHFYFRFFPPLCFSLSLLFHSLPSSFLPVHHSARHAVVLTSDGLTDSVWNWNPLITWDFPQWFSSCLCCGKRPTPIQTVQRVVKFADKSVIRSIICVFKSTFRNRGSALCVSTAQQLRTTDDLSLFLLQLNLVYPNMKTADLQT